MLNNIIYIILPVTLAVFTVILLTGNGAGLVNILSQGEKEVWDELALSKFCGKALLPFDFICFTAAVGEMFNTSWSNVATLCFAAFNFPYFIAVAVYANTGNRFKK